MHPDVYLTIVACSETLDYAQRSGRLVAPHLARFPLALLAAYNNVKALEHVAEPLRRTVVRERDARDLFAIVHGERGQLLQQQGHGTAQNSVMVGINWEAMKSDK